MARETGQSNEFGLGLLTLSAVVLLVAWPPPGTGVPPLFGAGTVLLAAPLSAVPLLIGLAAGAVYGRRIARRYESFPARILISVVGTLVPVGIEAAYLVYVIGFGPRAPAIAGPLVLAVVVGVLLEIPN